MRRLLVDANIFLEYLLDQDRADEVRQFLSQTQPSDICVSDFALHSIGVILLRLGRPELFRTLLQDLLDNGVETVSLPPEALMEVVEVAHRFRLDFDDAYQYCVAHRFDLELVSFDIDFDRTDIVRREPHELAKAEEQE